jgi:hypothetical protein
MAICGRAAEMAKGFLGGHAVFFNGHHIVVVKRSEEFSSNALGIQVRYNNLNNIRVEFNKHVARQRDGIGKLREYVETQCAIALMLGE